MNKSCINYSPQTVSAGYRIDMHSGALPSELWKYEGGESLTQSLMMHSSDAYVFVAKMSPTIIMVVINLIALPHKICRY